MTWRLAESLKVLRDQVNARWPTRDKSSDGSIGDPAHSARTSDHNPNDAGVVCAIDITHDPRSGCDSYALAEVLRAGRDPRIKYIISNRKICSPEKAWEWRPYTGTNPHDHHVHISVKGNYDSTAPWNLDAVAMPAPAHAAPPPPPVLRIGSTGDEVRALQEQLGIKAEFGPETKKAVAAFQLKHGLHDDGEVGPQTRTALKEEK